MNMTLIVVVFNSVPVALKTQEERCDFMRELAFDMPKWLLLFCNGHFKEREVGKWGGAY